MNIVESVLTGSVRAMAKILSRIENEDPAMPAILEKLFPHTGKARIIGITGFPGSGKSTIVNQMVKHLRSLRMSVGVLAVDPSSPFTGGAILGDRIRMNEISDDPEVFVRSLGTRGSLGGLAQAVYDCVSVMDAFGKDVILIETVGVGQSEIDIVGIADTTIMVCVPGLGDDIQAIKAGIMEIGDLLVINKADKPEADRVHAYLEMMVGLRANADDSSWKPHILETTALTGSGIDALCEATRQHWEYMVASGELESKRRQRIEAEVLRIVQNKLMLLVMEQIKKQGLLEKWIERVCRYEKSPATVAERLLEAVLSETRCRP